MSNSMDKEPMLDMFIFETRQLLEQLEQIIISSEKTNRIESSIDEIFRIMHTIKGSAAMMLFNNISNLAHSLEDIFYYIREEKPQTTEYTKLTDIVLEALDFIKNEITKIENGQDLDGDSSKHIDTAKKYLTNLKEQNPHTEKPDDAGMKTADAKKQKFYISYDRKEKDYKKTRYKAVIYFEEDCQMESIRAFTVMHNIKEMCDVIYYYPEDVIENSESEEIIRKEGFYLEFYSNLGIDELRTILQQTVFLRKLELDYQEEEEKETEPIKENKKQIFVDDLTQEQDAKQQNKSQEKDQSASGTKQSLISVNVSKLDMLMDLVGELVISEAMVTQNPELVDLPLESFHKAARQLEKITTELQDTVMSIRMVPLSTTFQKMNRIVRDMSKKLSKEVVLEIIGEETEVDKNIIEHISDPLMHIIRNSIDHGIEDSEERILAGKDKVGKITLEAKSAGGDVWIIIKDDGKGLNKDKILHKAVENGLVHKPENELTDKEIYSFIFLPGFSTKEKVTEFSGRGVGMDVVTKNVEKVGGTVLVDSTAGVGSAISIKIPLTLAIINGMIIRVGNSTYIIPTISIKESFKLKENDVVNDPDGNEMILVRGECFPILRLHRMYKVETNIMQIHDGIIVMVEDGTRSMCVFADELLGEQQVVVKALPKYMKKVKGLAGCTLLGDGSISLILDISGLVKE